MKEFTTALIEEKNKLAGSRAWAHLVEIVVNVNTTAYFTSHPETLTYNSQTYAPIPMIIGQQEQAGDGSLPQLSVDVSNFRGLAYQFARDNDLSLNDVTIRLVNTGLLSAGNDDSITLQILGSAFGQENARFNLGFNFNFDAEGPRRTYNRRDFPSIPYNFRRFGII